MKIIEDYNSWFEDNKELLVLLETNNSPIYERLDDVIKVVSYIEALYLAQNSIDEDLIVIFEVGFSFIYETIEEIKLYYENYLNKDFILLNSYSSVINYILYLNDLKDSLIEEKLYNEDIKNVFSKILSQLDDILKDKKPFKIETLDSFNDELDKYLSSFEVVTVLEVFSRIAEELSL